MKNEFHFLSSTDAMHGFGRTIRTIMAAALPVVLFISFIALSGSCKSSVSTKSAGVVNNPKPDSMQTMPTQTQKEVVK